MNRLKQLRKEKKLTQDKLASEFNFKFETRDDFKAISKMNISNWENGKHEIKHDRAKQLAEFFDVDQVYLLGFSDMKNTSERIDNVKNKDLVTSEEDFKNQNQWLVDLKIEDYDFDFYSKLITHKIYEIGKIRGEINFMLQKHKSFKNRKEIVEMLLEKAIKDKSIEEDLDFLYLDYLKFVNNLYK